MSAATIADKYVLLKRLATGGMAEVYLARQMGLDGFEKLVVLKRVLPTLAERSDFLEMFLDEARTAADLRHPNVVNIFEIGQDRGTYYMVMEYLHGQNLRRIQRFYEQAGETAPLGHVLQTILGVANGLHYAHMKTDLRGRPLGIVHRDVSPQNIIITYDGAVKIVDFGIAKARSQTAETAPGVVKGKFEYMSPEQADGETLDARSDQFCLGIVLWELTTGRRLFDRATDYATLQAVSASEVTPPSEINKEYPAGLEEIVMRALKKIPADRYPTCADMANDLEEFLTDSRVPHSAARLGRWMQEIFKEEIEESAVIPLTEVMDDRREPEPLDQDDVDDDLPPTTISAVARKDPTDSHPVVDVMPEPAPKPKPERKPQSEPKPAPRGEPGPASQSDSFAAAVSEFLPDLEAARDSKPRHHDTVSPAEPTSSVRPWDVPTDHDGPDDAGLLGAIGDYLLNVKKAAPRRRTNLVDDPGVFVGREKELAALQKLFGRGDRLVTVLGPGGAGKTRLALRYGHSRKTDESLPGGVWFVDLTDTHTVGTVTAAVGAAMGIPLTVGRTDVEVSDLLGEHIHILGPSLVILDNFDEIVELAPQTVSRWLSLAPQTLFLVTSRELLRVHGEVVYDLQPLSVPGEGDSVQDSEAVNLFVHRARALNPNYKLTAHDAPIVGEIVRYLEGIPLAIELAAGRVGLLSLEDLLARIKEHIDVLSGGRRGHARQATLRNTIDWSWNLLTADEQLALAQCAVFRGGFTVEGAEAVLDLRDASDALPILDIIQRLREKSLLRIYEPPDGGEQRLSMYVSIRKYAEEKLADLGADENAYGRHAAYYLKAAETWSEGLYGRDGQSARERLTMEMPNLLLVAQRALARHPLTPAAARRAVQAILSLDGLLATQGPFTTHLELLDSAVNATAIPGVDPIVRARVLQARGKARRARGDHTDALADLAEAIAIARRHNDPHLEASSLVFLANLFEEKGRHPKAQAHFEDALRIARDLGDTHTEANALRLLGVLHLELGELTDAARVLERSIDLAQQCGDQRLVGMALGNIAGLYRELDQVDLSQETYEKALTIFMDIGDRRRQGMYIGWLGLLHHDRGSIKSALVHYNQAVKMAREAGDRRSEAFFLGWLGAADAEVDRIDEGELAIRASRELFVDLGDANRAALAELLQAHVDLARGRQLAQVGDTARARAQRHIAEQRMEAVRHPPNGGAPSAGAPRHEDVPLADRSDEVRLALRTLTRAMGR